MKINLSKKQYRQLLLMSNIANHVLGILGDMVSEEDYKELSDEAMSLESYLMGFAKDFQADDLVEEFEGRVIPNETHHQEAIMPIMEDYDEENFFSTLVNRLAWRDFRRDHSEGEMEAMAKKNGGYFGVEIHSCEEKYRKEFEKHGVERVEVGK